MVGTGMSRGAERERIWCNCGLGDGGRRSEDVDADANVEKLLGDSLEGGFGGGEGGRSPWGCGRSSGIGILLRCTVRLDGGLYAFGGSSSLMRCSLAEGWVSYITYWCSSSDKLPVATSAEIIRNEHSTGWGDSRRGVTAFVSQALHVLNYLEDFGYVRGRSGANGDEQHRILSRRV